MSSASSLLQDDPLMSSSNNIMPQQPPKRLPGTARAPRRRRVALAVRPVRLAPASSLRHQVPRHREVGGAWRGRLDQDGVEALKAITKGFTDHKYPGRCTHRDTLSV